MTTEKKKIVNQETGKLGKHIDAVLRTESGRALWAALFHACGYNVSSLRFNQQTGEIAVLSTECYEAQRRVYINLRRLASRELLAVAEQLAEVPVFVAQLPEEERK